MNCTYPVFAAGCALIALPLLAQQRVLQIDVEDHRPLARATELVERKIGIAVNYEDPVYAFAGDLEDVTGRVANAAFRASHPDKRILAPRRFRLNCKLRFELDPATQQIRDQIGVVTRLVDEYRAAQGTGGFRVVKSGGAIVVLPDEMKNARGVLEAQAAVMSRAVHIQAGDRGGIEMLNALCEQLTGQAGHPVVLGSFPENVFLTQRSHLEADVDGPALDVFDRLMESLRNGDGGMSSSKPHLAWELLYDPGLHTHFFNLRIVAVDAPVPVGGVILRPHRAPQAAAANPNG